MAVVHNIERLSEFAGHTSLEVEICPNCGVLFAAPAHMLRERRFDGKSFYCPSGHSMSYDGDRNRIERQRDGALQRAGHLASRLEQTEASLRAQRGATTRIKHQRDRERTRVANGVCPCCNRTFKDLARHMERQHPEFPPQEPEA